VLALLRAEVERTLALVGRPTVAALGPEVVTEVTPV
jgi:hypothetical protein